MVLRVEYILTVAIAITSILILQSKPKESISPSRESSSKELYFKNFTLLELNETTLKNSLIAEEATKYQEFTIP